MLTITSNNSMTVGVAIFYIIRFFIWINCCDIVGPLLNIEWYQELKPSTCNSDELDLVPEKGCKYKVTAALN